MSFIYQQFNSFLNLGVCKEYSVMAKSKSTTGKQKGAVVRDTATVPATQPVSAGTTQVEAAQPETSKPETRKMEIVRSDAKTNVVPINLEEEIRRRAYELSKERGFQAGREHEDWLNAEREVMQRYHQQSA
jgi:hypothetical protein